MKKNKKVLKVVTAVTSLAVVSAISFGATVAYLSAQTERKKNVFTSGGVNITTNETDFPLSGTVQFKPGDVINKNPTITVKDQSEDSYLAFTVEYFRTYDDSLDSGLTENVDWFKDGNKKWTKMSYDTFKKYFATIDDWDSNWQGGDDLSEPGNYSHVYPYYYKNATDDIKDGSDGDLIRVKSTDGATDPIFTKVTVLKDTTAMTPAPGKTTPEFKIIVTGYAVRAESYASSTEGQEALEELIKENAHNVGITGME